MDTSLLYDCIELSRLGKFRENVRKDDACGFLKDELELRKKLESALNEEQLELVDSYFHCVRMCEEHVYFYSDIKLLNYGIKIGMQIQKAFDEDEP